MASARVLSPSLCKRLCTWNFTVCSDNRIHSGNFSRWLYFDCSICPANSHLNNRAGNYPFSDYPKGHFIGNYRYTRGHSLINYHADAVFNQ